MPTKTIKVRGHTIRTRTQRRYIAIAMRTDEAISGHSVYVTFAEVIKRSDNPDVVRAAQYKYGGYMGSFAVCVDTTTGEEI
jgi:hypothetical protein